MKTKSLPIKTKKNKGNELVCWALDRGILRPDRDDSEYTEEEWAKYYRMLHEIGYLNK